MTASDLKQDANTWKVQKNAYLLGHKHNLQIFGVFPFVKLKRVDRWINHGVSTER